jgi:hypothetical protein
VRGLVTVGFLHPGYWAACFGNSLTDLLFFDAAHRQRIVSHKFGQMGKECGAAHIHAGRNQFASALLDESEADWLFMIDSDMGFAPDTVERLIDSAHAKDRPVVGGLAFGQKHDGKGPFHGMRNRMVPTLYQMYENTEKVGFVPMFDYPRGELVPVDATGAACLLIHRLALAEVRDHHGPRWFTPLEVPKGEGGRTEFGEDISFCIRLAACGIPIFVDTSVKTTHDKGGVYLDEETYDLQRAMQELFPKDDPL